MEMMSEFAAIFNGYIRQKGYSIRSLSKRLGVPSSTLTKLCNGTRSPRHQKETIERVCDVLMLTPEQREALHVTLEKEIIGADVYNSRTSIKNMIESMVATTLPEQRTADNTVLPALAVADKKSDVYAILHTFLGNLAGNHTLELILPPDDPVVIEALCRVVNSWPTRIRHILPLAASDGHSGKMNSQNIDRIQRIQQLLLGAGSRNETYQPYYYYERSGVGTGNMMQFPNVLISDFGVLQCSCDYSHAIYSANRTVQKYYRRLFAHQISLCRPLVTVCHDVYQQLARYAKTMEAGNCSEELRVLSWQPCLLWAVSPQEVMHFLPSDMPFRGQYLELYLPYLNQLACWKQMRLYFSMEGLIEFARTGTLREIPKGFLRTSLPVSFRVELLRRLLDHTRSRHVILQIARDEKLRIGFDAQIVSYGADTIILSMLNHASGNRMCFVEELSANWSALDFLESLENSDLFLSPEESCRLLQEVIDTCVPDKNTFNLPARAGARAVPLWVAPDM